MSLKVTYERRLVLRCLAMYQRLPKKMNKNVIHAIRWISLDYHSAMVWMLSMPGRGIARWVVIEGQKIWHKPSLRGDPPAVLTGRLRGSVREEFDPEKLQLVLSVGGESNIKKMLGIVTYARELEEKWGRPFFAPVIKQRAPEWREKFIAAVKGTIRDRWK